MLQYIKDELLNDVDKLIELLEHFGYCGFSVKPKYMTFARNEEGSRKSIVIQLRDNDALIVHDYPKNIVCDIFNYIIKERGEEFKNVIQAAKKIVGVDSYYAPEPKYRAFAGFYHQIKSKTQTELITYDEAILKRYKPCGNLRFLRDNISLEAQRYFGIGYSVQDQAITIPIYSEDGRLIGIKCRINKDPEENEQKYYYLTDGCQMSQTLYGFSHNYQHLEGADFVYVFESEKSVLQNFSMNYRCAVALGSSSLSKKQAQMLLSLNAKRYVFMMDKGLPFETIKKNIIALKTYGKMKEFETYWWDPGEDVTPKASASDLGLERFEMALQEELVLYEED